MSRVKIGLSELPKILSQAIKDAYEMSEKQVRLHNHCVSERVDALDTFLINIERCVTDMSNKYYLCGDVKDDV
jgi:phosphate uptake regulator